MTVDGRRLEVAAFVAPHAPDAAPSLSPIVLLHEGLGSVSMWKSFPQRLAECTGRRVVAYSRYGYGESDVLDADRPLDYMQHEGEVVLPELLAALGLERPVLFGHSDGASIALIAAGAHPELASALVLEAPHVFVEDRSIEGIEAARTAYLETDLPRRLARYHRDADRTFWGWNRAWLDPAFRAWNIERYLDGIRVPVLVVQGDDDEYGTKAQYEAIAARVSQTRVVAIEGCGHSPHREYETKTIKAVADFILGHR